MLGKCEECDIELQFVPADWPFGLEYWICIECEKTYVFVKGDNYFDDIENPIGMS